MTKIVGGCLCGGIRYTSDAAPALTAVCHCKSCQKQTSSAFSILVAIPKGSLKIEGAELVAFRGVGETGEPVTRRFCPDCGSSIVYDVGATPGLDWVRAGTLDDPSWFTPQMHMWCDSAQPWVPINEELPRFAKNPPLA